jgi:NADH:ubiquinone oxidoreductase subunit 6 (subunit J)
LLFNVNEFSFITFSNFMDVTTSTMIIKKIGIFLFLEYYYFLFFSGLLLLISLIGAIFLTNYKKGYYTKTQYNQCFRKSNLFNTQVF